MTRGPAAQRGLGAGALLAALLGWPAAATANGLTISPVVVEINAPRQVVSVTVRNGTARPMTLQSQTRLWRQVNGVDRHEPSEDLLVVPAIAQIQPNASQVFRITLRRPVAAPLERTYRLVLDDITDEQQPSDRAAVSFKFSHNLPVMVAPMGKVTHSVHWSPCEDKPGAAAGALACVRVLNTGNRRVKVQSLEVSGEGWRQTLPLKAGENVLAGASREWHVPRPSAQAGAVQQVQVFTAQGATLRAEAAASVQAER